MAEAILAGVVIAASTLAINWVYWSQYRTSAPARRSTFVLVHFISVCAIVLAYLAVFARTFEANAGWGGPQLFGVASFVLGAGLFVWSSLIHKTSLIPRDDAGLTVAGPYRFVRHPIYSSGMFGALGLLLAAPSLGLAVDWVVLVVCMLLLIRSEERELRRRMPSYVDYALRTAALVPFLRPLKRARPS